MNYMHGLIQVGLLYGCVGIIVLIGYAMKNMTREQAVIFFIVIATVASFILGSLIP